MLFRSAPRRVSFFVWIAAWVKILTGDNLRRRGFSIVDWCYMCRYIGEIVDHLMIHGKRAYLSWSFVVRTFAVSWVLQGRVIDLLFGWRNWLGKYLSNIWNLTALCLMWCIWRERNNCTFEDVESLGNQLLASFMGSLFHWSRAWGLTSSDSLPMFIDLLLPCS